MKSVLIVFICIFSIINCEIKIIKSINNFVGVQFDKVGEMQLIQEYAALTIDIELNDLQFIVEKLNLIEIYAIENHENSLVLFHKIWDKKRVLIKLLQELKEIKKNSPRVHRVKGRFIASVGNTELSNSCKSIIHFLKTIIISDEKIKTDDLELIAEVLKSLVVRLKIIYDMLVNKTLNASVISIHEFEKGLQAIETKLENQNLQMPFAELTEIIRRFQFKLESNGTVLQFSIYIPLVSSEEIYDLYEIEQIPVIIPELNVSIQTTFEYRFLAHSKDGAITLYENINKCMKSDNYYCDAENPIYFEAFNDCLINSFRNKILDGKLCQNDIIFTSDKDFIIKPKQHEGWWFSMLSPEKFILNYTDNQKQEIFYIDGNGILLMDNHYDVQVRDKLLLPRNYRNDTERH